MTRDEQVDVVAHEGHELTLKVEHAVEAHLVLEPERCDLRPHGGLEVAAAAQMELERHAELLQLLRHERQVVDALHGDESSRERESNRVSRLTGVELLVYGSWRGHHGSPDAAVEEQERLGIERFVRVEGGSAVALHAG